MSKSEIVKLRISADEKERWQKAAVARGFRSMSEMIRALINEEIQWVPVGFTDEPPTVRAQPEKKTPYIKPKQCSRWFHHRPGTMCKECGK